MTEPQAFQHDQTEIALEDLFNIHYTGKTAIAPHLRSLRALAHECTTIREFGVKRGASSVALLLGAGACGHLTSYDIRETPEARSLERLVGKRWKYVLESSLAAPSIGCDMLFIDSLHTYAQTSAELERHAADVERLLVFHDTITFGSVGADGESGRQLWDYSRHVGESVPVDKLGVRPAIDHLMMRDPSWRIRSHQTHSHGLLVLERRT